VSDRDELVELLGRYAAIPDTNDFDVLPSTVFTDPVTMDFESLGRPPARTFSLAPLMALFRVTLASFTATHHAITNHRVAVDGDRATIRAHVRAEHWLRPDLVESGPTCWLVVGFYDDAAVRTAAGWRLDSVTLSVTHQENTSVYDRAIAAATNKNGM
jgi:SnoaL-like domain